MPAAFLTAVVQAMRLEAEDIISIELRPAPGESFPAFDAGSHIDLHLPNGMVRSYSLLNSQDETDRYVIGVLKDRASRGGSRCVHEALRLGQRLTISAPINNFALHEDADHSVLLAGGIGITPLLSMARRLKAMGRSIELIYAARARPAAAFVDELKALGVPVQWHFDADAGGPPDLRALLTARVPGSNTHYYACGPSVMLDAFEKVCADLGYANAHIERFTSVELKPADDALQTYVVELRRSGKLLTVGPGQSLLGTLKAGDVDVATSCEEGICGTCEVKVLEGEPDHRDSILSASERAANRSMMVCVSGCKSERLVLDL